MTRSLNSFLLAYPIEPHSQQPKPPLLTFFLTSFQNQFGRLRKTTKTKIRERRRVKPRRETLNPKMLKTRTRNPTILRKTGVTRKMKVIPTWLAKTRSPRRTRRRLDRSHRVVRARVIQRDLQRIFPMSPESRICKLILRRHQLLVLASLKVSFIT
jgi:hypothetical protein